MMQPFFSPPRHPPDRLKRSPSFHGKGWYHSALVGALVASTMLGGVALALQEGEGSSSLPPSAMDLTHRIEILEAANHATSERLANIERALASIESARDGLAAEPARLLEPISDQLRGNRLALAVLQLRIASQTHLPFESELAVVRQLGQEEEGLPAVIAALTPHAVTGVATVSELRDGFGLILLPKLQPLLEGSNQSWSDWAFSWMDMIFIPFASSRPTPLQQSVISATDRLTEDDLNGAVEQITQIDGPAAALVARWLKEANARLAVDAAYSSLSGIAVALLGRTL